MQFTKDNLTIIISENYNYTNANITAAFLHAFDIGFAITPFNFSIRYDTFEHTTTNPLCEFSYNTTHAWGACTEPANIVEDVFFSYTPLTQILALNNVTFDILYSNFHRTDNGSCSIDINNTVYGMFENISLPEGSYTYTISCTDDNLPTRTATGSFVAQNTVLFVENPVQYQDFLIEYTTNTPINCSQCILTIDTTQFSWDTSTQNSCAYTANLDAAENITVSCTPGETTTQLITLQPNFLHYNQGKELGRFTISGGDPNIFTILYSFKFISVSNLDLTSNLMFDRGNLRAISGINSGNLFYYKGDLFNDNKKIEVLN